ncbi:MAG: hypothetical protein A3H88_00445 [Candidatus Blackburnbacteria bacterium RIFCSPLOWO2_02_FULL_44_9]|uniref:Glycosyl transferase family 28 C-terminal domain-containing protein n=1 Tax=Candidatus Blackburnbacteria bacterium RIFCSPHIGHO2_02_FULL_44_20 TaxID=1797516 RepID=A0A1G1V8D4_9BACT|nr:MAG: hypothetical protein A3D26_02035 [Candidatus Blackburnbacteria bacterium RIFCSPHIGHO2_02_FULL_44_20]OGY15986.1 MAG: hypothetical protein A3H88_00445 [Candidatus Blackburnbacteria bacterium RIFCSPLOWO2_02_FULL_44_9]
MLKNLSIPNAELDLPRTLESDRKHLAESSVPIVTTSASFRSDILKSLGEKARINDHDIVFSRGHFSMAIAILKGAEEKGLTTWLTDPTNYVSRADWQKLKFVVTVGQLIARFPFLKYLKDQLDTLTRNKLPVTQAIEKPLLFATSEVTKPIISVHYETGNILVKEGRQVVQVVTDPHIRPQYLTECDKKNIHFAVFNNSTKIELLKKAKEEGKTLEEERVTVTGPPVDPRIIKARKNKSPLSFKKRPLRLCVTTGGLGQNKEEIAEILENLAPQIKENHVQVVLYASTLPDFREMYEGVIAKFNIPISSDLADENSEARIIYSSSIVNANETLIKHGFPWSDGFITKPSGDMAYDAAAAGCFILSLTPWGDWEANVAKIFEELSILRKAETKNITNQLNDLTNTGWISSSIKNALNIDKLYLEGVKNILALQQKIASKVDGHGLA